VFDHHPILFSLEAKSTAKSVSPNAKGWSWRRLDKDKLVTFLQEFATPPGQRTFDDKGLSIFLEKACDNCMPRRSFHGRRRPVHWWTEEIAALRKVSFPARRMYQKTWKRKGPKNCEEEHCRAREASEALRLEIRRSQERCWVDLCR